MTPKEKILIFQFGSLGDTVISMPCYREIVRRHPNSERYVLTNFPIGAKMVQAEALLGPCGLVHGALRYPMPLRGVSNIIALYRSIRRHKFEQLYYLSPEKALSNLVRHFLFFKACGIRRIRGIPWTQDKRLPRSLEGGNLWESEASRLLRVIGAQVEAAPPEPKDRSLDTTEEENRAASWLLEEIPQMGRFIAVALGGRVSVKDWGTDNWINLLAQLSSAHPGLGAVFIGSHDERERNDLLAAAWNGPTLNSCGRLTARESAALIRRASLFLGHDSGPMHLAAAVEVPIVALFSARDVPGKWFSDRPGDRFFYNRPPCFGCGLVQATDCPNSMICMTGHNLNEIASAVTERIAGVQVKPSRIKRVS